MRFLLIKTSSLGDILQTFPVLSFLRQKFPHAKVDWVVEEPFSELLSAHPEVSRVIPVATRKWRKNLFNKATWKEILTFRNEVRQQQYEAIFDFQGNVKSSLLLSQAKGKVKVGFSNPPEWPNLLFTTSRSSPPAGRNIREDYLHLVQTYAGSFEKVPYEVSLTIGKEERAYLETLPKGEYRVLVCPGAAWPNKCLAEKQLRHLLTQLEKKKPAHFLFSWGTEKEREVARRVAEGFPHTLLKRLSLPLLQHVMKACDLVVAMDSLPLHLCGTTSTPTLSFFGPSVGQKYAPLGDQHHFIQGSCPYGLTFDKRCPKLRTCATGACIKDLEVSIVADVV